MFQNKFEIKMFENGDIILGAKPCWKNVLHDTRGARFFNTLVQDLSETNQTRIFLNYMKLSSLYP